MTQTAKHMWEIIKVMWEISFSHNFDNCPILPLAFHQSNFRQLLIEAAQKTGIPIFLLKNPSKQNNTPTQA